MDIEARLAAATALIRLARGEDHRDRVDAARGLAGFADLPEVGEVLLDLVLDKDDTYVTAVTAEALLRRGDMTALAIFCAGYAVAEYQHIDELAGTVQWTVGIVDRDRDAAVLICRGLIDDPARSDQVRAGAQALLTNLIELRPVLLAEEKH
ncbi:MAG TPA: hypothetical protein VGJ45_17020 [Pseudonocardiaceae bacterium]|jgi:hypothetical protein